MSVSRKYLRLAAATAAGVLSLTAAVAAPLAAQAVPVRDLPKPVTEVEDPFSMIGGSVVELRGGKVLMIDAVDAELYVVDFADGSRTMLGRTGSGPGEYRLPAALLRVVGDSVWVLDAAQMRLVAFNPDLSPGRTIPFMTFDQASSSALTMPFVGDRAGRVYASSMSINMAQGSGQMRMQIPDSVTITRVDVRDQKVRAPLAKVRFPTSGTPEMQQVGQGQLKYKMAFPGLVAADSWTVFPDGRVAIVRGADYSVEFIAPDGKRSAPVRVAYTRIPVTKADQDAEMAEARRQMEEQGKAAQKAMPAGVSMQFELTPPESWPSHYPAITPMQMFASPDGDLWVRRSIPFRQGREQWDVIDATGKLVASWRLPARTTVVGVGANGTVYTARSDEDDLRYAQKVSVPRR
jgi:hypothetical protein